MLKITVSVRVITTNYHNQQNSSNQQNKHVFESDTASDDNGIRTQRQSKQIKSKSKRTRKRRTKPTETSKTIKLGTSSNNKEKARRAKKPEAREARAVAADARAKEPLISGTTRSNAPLSADSFHEDDLSSCYFSD